MEKLSIKNGIMFFSIGFLVVILGAVYNKIAIRYTGVVLITAGSVIIGKRVYDRIKEKSIAKSLTSLNIIKKRS